MMSLTQDQYRFFMANIVGFSLALPYKYIPRSLRNEYNYLPGVLMIYYCFGRQANLLILFSAISYIVCRFTPGEYVQRVTMCSSLALLSYAHLSRQILDYGGYVLDISGPFMIATQKMTSLGFCLYDGKRKQLLESGQPGEMLASISPTEVNNNNHECNRNIISKDTNNNNYQNSIDTKMLMPKSADSHASASSVVGSTCNINEPIKKIDKDYIAEEQKKYAVTTVPSFNQFMGYFFHFPSVLCGPIMYFKDYRDFVEMPQDKELPPGRHTAVAKKLIISFTCAILHLTLTPRFDIEFLRSPEFLIHSSIIVRFYYIIIFTMLSRLKYYVAWHLGEAISNTSGIGFSGYGSDGKPNWDLISNMDLLKFETSTNLRDAIHAWNKTTQVWLRRTAYERAPRKLSVVATYMLSAVWHGFYPGYYMTFLGGALFTHSSRNGRRLIRPLFQKGTFLPKAYDVLTFILTRLTIGYAAFPFVTLDFRNNFEIYRSLHFSIHLLGLGGVLLGFVVRRK